MKITTEIIKKKYFTCERCEITWQEKMWMVNCPVHGEFCVSCAKKYSGHSMSENGESIVHIVCPDCSFEMTEKVQEITRPYVEIRRDFVGVWIGSIST